MPTLAGERGDPSDTRNGDKVEDAAPVDVAPAPFVPEVEEEENELVFAWTPITLSMPPLFPPFGDPFPAARKADSRLPTPLIEKKDWPSTDLGLTERVFPEEVIVVVKDDDDDDDEEEEEEEEEEDG